MTLDPKRLKASSYRISIILFQSKEEKKFNWVEVDLWCGRNVFDNCPQFLTSCQDYIASKQCTNYCNKVLLVTLMLGRVPRYVQFGWHTMGSIGYGSTESSLMKRSLIAVAK